MANNITTFALTTVLNFQIKTAVAKFFLTIMCKINEKIQKAPTLTFRNIKGFRASYYT